MEFTYLGFSKRLKHRLKQALFVLLEIFELFFSTYSEF